MNPVQPPSNPAASKQPRKQKKKRQLAQKPVSARPKQQAQSALNAVLRSLQMATARQVLEKRRPMLRRRAAAVKKEEEQRDLESRIADYTKKEKRWERWDLSMNDRVNPYLRLLWDAQNADLVGVPDPAPFPSAVLRQNFNKTVTVPTGGGLLVIWDPTQICNQATTPVVFQCLLTVIYGPTVNVDTASYTGSDTVTVMNLKQLMPANFPTTYGAVRHVAASLRISVEDSAQYAQGKIRALLNPATLGAYETQGYSWEPTAIMQNSNLYAEKEENQEPHGMRMRWLPRDVSNQIYEEVNVQPWMTPPMPHITATYTGASSSGSKINVEIWFVVECLPFPGLSGLIPTCTHTVSAKSLNDVQDIVAATTKQTFAPPPDKEESVWTSVWNLVKDVATDSRVQSAASSLFMSLLGSHPSTQNLRMSWMPSDNDQRDALLRVQREEADKSASDMLTRLLKHQAQQHAHIEGLSEPDEQVMKTKQPK